MIVRGVPGGPRGPARGPRASVDVFGPTHMKTVKLFIGMHLPDMLKRELLGRCDILQRVIREELGGELGQRGGVGQRGDSRILRCVPEEKLHMTLLFLGDVRESLLEEVYDAFDHAFDHATTPPVPPNSARRPHPAPRLTLTGVGAFPDSRHPRVVWVGAVDPSGETERLAQELRDQLGPAGLKHGFPVESRPFVPHITIAYPARRITAAARHALSRSLTRVQTSLATPDGAEIAGGRDASPASQASQTSRAWAVPRIAVIESTPSSAGTRYHDLHWTDFS